MKKFWILLKINWQNSLEYRSDMMIWGITWGLIPFIGLAIWLAASASGANLPYSQTEFAVYFLTVALLNTLTGAWGSWFISEEIVNGNFSKYLIKPLSLIQEYLANNLAEKVIKGIVVLTSVLLIGYFLGLSFSSLNLDSKKIVLFFISLAFAFMIYFFIEISMGLTAIWFSDVDFVNTTFDILGLIFMGRLIPLVLLPGLLHDVSLYLPFRYIISFPAEILLGKVSQADLVFGFIMQTLWVILVVAMYKIIFRRGSRVYQGYGG